MNGKKTSENLKYLFGGFIKNGKRKKKGVMLKVKGEDWQIIFCSI